MQREVSSKIMSGICANRSSNDGKELNKTSKKQQRKDYGRGRERGRDDLETIPCSSSGA